MYYIHERSKSQLTTSGDDTLPNETQAKMLDSIVKVAYLWLQLSAALGQEGHLLGEVG